jgi:hypothetical protein
LIYAKKPLADIGAAIAKAHIMLEQYCQPLVERRRSDPGTAENHRNALLSASLITLN